MVSGPARKMVADPAYKLVTGPAYKLVPGPAHKLVTGPARKSKLGSIFKLDRTIINKYNKIKMRPSKWSKVAGAAQIRFTDYKEINR